MAGELTSSHSSASNSSSAHVSRCRGRIESGITVTCGHFASTASMISDESCTIVPSAHASCGTAEERVCGKSTYDRDHESVSGRAS